MTKLSGKRALTNTYIGDMSSLNRGIFNDNRVEI